MAITKVFKGNSDIYGTFAYMENDRLIIGENRGSMTVYTYQGSIEAFRKSREMLQLAARNRPLLDDIMNYYQLWKHDKNMQEAANMNNMEKLISNLQKYSYDYYHGKTLDGEQVAKDCLAAADKLYMFSNSDVADIVSAGVQKETMGTKLCEIKVDRKDSLQELVYHLTANGYRVETTVVWKEYPGSGIDYWTITIFDKE